MRVPLALTTGLLAALCDVFAAISLADFGPVQGLIIAVALHVLAVWVAYMGAQRARGGDLRSVERDCVVLAAALLPWIGPLLAWTLPHRSVRDQTEDAHAAFERYLEHTKAEAPRWERTLFTGDVERDLARELDAQTFEEVFLYGPADQKRNAVKRLAETGSPDHLRQIRACLVDPDQEVRLFAHNELDQIVRRHQLGLQLAQRALDAALADAERGTDDAVEAEVDGAEESDDDGPPQADPETRVRRARLDLARTHYELGHCGALDDQASAFHFRVAATIAKEIPVGSPEALAARVVETRALLASGELEDAERALDDLRQERPVERRDLIERDMAEAEVAYALRRFDRVRKTAAMLRSRREPLPAWMEAIAPLEAAS